MKNILSKSQSFTQSISFSTYRNKSNASLTSSNKTSRQYNKDNILIFPASSSRKKENDQSKVTKKYHHHYLSNNSSLQRSVSTNFTFNNSGMKIAFGKIVPKICQKKKLLNNKNDSINNEIKLKKQNPKRAETSKEILNVFKTGLRKKEMELVLGSEEERKKSIFSKKSEEKGFPIISSKKMVKNILPKEYDFNKVKSPEEVLRNAYHPVVRYQKNVLNKHINAINQEINVNYSNMFNLIKKEKFSEKFRMCQDLIDLEKDTKLIEMISDLINNNFKLANEIDEVLEAKKKKEEFERKQKILLRFKQVLIRAAIHFKRLNIELDDFLSKNSKTIKPFEEESSYNLICAIKDKDPDAVIRMVKENNFVVFDFDHVKIFILLTSLIQFKQTPLHWAAKRNLYQIISLLVSKGANASAQDEIGRTPLHVAAIYNNIESLQILLYELANPLIKNNQGQTPFDVAVDPVSKFILQRASTVNFFILLLQLHKLREGINIKLYEKSVKSGLEFLFVEEIKTNFESLKPYIYI